MLKESRFRLDIRKIIFTMRVVRHWNRLLRGIMDAPLLEVLKDRPYGALGNQWEVSLPRERLELSGL